MGQLGESGANRVKGGWMSAKDNDPASEFQRSGESPRRGGSAPRRKGTDRRPPGSKASRSAAAGGTAAGGQSADRFSPRLPLRSYTPLFLSVAALTAYAAIARTYGSGGIALYACLGCIAVCQVVFVIGARREIERQKAAWRRRGSERGRPGKGSASDSQRGRSQTESDGQNEPGGQGSPDGR